MDPGRAVVSRVDSCKPVLSSSACLLRLVNCKVFPITEKLVFHWFYKGLLSNVYFLINCKFSRSAETVVFIRFFAVFAEFQLIVRFSPPTYTASLAFSM